MAISEKTIKKLYAKSGNTCAFPGCTQQLTGNTNLSEIAHIIGKRQDSNRHIPNFNNGNFDEEDNLILLCPTHHTLIDKEENEEEYSAEILREMKKNHEKWVKNSLNINDPTREFIQNFLEICKENSIDRLLTEFHFPNYFDDKLFDCSQELIWKLTKLKSDKLTIHVPSKYTEAVDKFITLLECYTNNLSCTMSPSSCGIAIPHHPIQEETQKELNTIYREIKAIYLNLLREFQN